MNDQQLNPCATVATAPVEYSGSDIEFDDALGNFGWNIPTDNQTVKPTWFSSDR